MNLMMLRTVLLAALAQSLLVLPLPADDTLTILPAEVVLTGPESRQKLLVETVSDQRFTGPAEGAIEWSSSDPNVVAVENAILIPKQNGTATITAKAGTRTASAKVTVKDIAAPHVWSFRNHVLAVFAKTGCNMGACHGALAGKGGFRLSLRGYAPETDWQAIVKQARGRRIELADPGRSLLLAKPTGALPHKGGLRFDPDSLEYRVIAEWISSGAPAPTEADPHVVKLEVLPEDVQLKVGQTQDMLVRAHYSDGHTEDVTRWARFAATNEAVAKIDQDGRVSVIGHGDGAVTAWFASQIVIARITSPYPYAIPDDVYSSAPRRNFIDEEVLTKLHALKLRPSPVSADHEFIRRAFLDTIGTLPTVDEVKAFIADTAPDKRDRLIDTLLSRPEFVDFWTLRWSDLLLLNGEKLRPKALKAYYEWVHNEVQQNTPWDQFVRKIVTSTGSSVENGETNFFALHQDPETMAENVSQAFMGLSIACAKCHNHPLEKWTNSQYYSFANLFSRVRAKGWGGDFRGGDGVRTLYVVPAGELLQPLTGKALPPAPLDGEPVPFDAPDDRRIHLANWLTSPGNPYFTRAIVNRVWAAYFATGLIEEVDDLRMSNPSSNDALMNSAAKFLVDQKYDLKALMRAILQSQTYQRSSQPLDENKDEQRFYSRYYPRRLMAEVLLDAVSQVTDVPTDFTHIAFPGGDRQETKDYAKGTRAIQLRDSAVDSYFLKTFGRNPRQITCECERTEEPSMVQVLHIANGDTINQKLRAKEGRVSTLLASGKSSAAIVEEVFLIALARQPTEAERTGMVTALEEAPDADQTRLVLEDIVWSLLSTREFLFNH